MDGLGEQRVGDIYLNLLITMRDGDVHFRRMSYLDAFKTILKGLDIRWQDVVIKETVVSYEVTDNVEDE